LSGVDRALACLLHLLRERHVCDEIRVPGKLRRGRRWRGDVAQEVPEDVERLVAIRPGRQLLVVAHESCDGLLHVLESSACEGSLDFLTALRSEVLLNHRQRVHVGDKHVIRYQCREKGCGEFFDVTPGTPFKLRNELAAKHSANHLVSESEDFLESRGKT
jgi:hypothetical protein